MVDLSIVTACFVESNWNLQLSRYMKLCVPVKPIEGPNSWEVRAVVDWNGWEVFDGFWRCLMVFDGVWWFLMVFDRCWWFLIVVDGFWSLLMVFDDLLILFDGFWWFLVVFDGFWRFLMVFDAFWWFFDGFWRFFKFLMVVGGFWMFLMVFDGFWWCLTVFDGFWLFLIVFDGRILNHWNLVELNFTTEVLWHPNFSSTSVWLWLPWPDSANGRDSNFVAITEVWILDPMHRSLAKFRRHLSARCGTQVSQSGVRSWGYWFGSLEKTAQKLGICFRADGGVSMTLVCVDDYMSLICVYLYIVSMYYIYT